MIAQVSFCRIFSMECDHKRARKEAEMKQRYLFYVVAKKNSKKRSRKKSEKVLPDCNRGPGGREADE